MLKLVFLMILFMVLLMVLSEILLMVHLFTTSSNSEPHFIQFASPHHVLILDIVLIEPDTSRQHSTVI